MQRRGFRYEERAASPVVGVVLMIAITVVLGSVIGTFTLGLDDGIGATAPQVQFALHYDRTATSADCGNASSGDGTLILTHRGGTELSTADTTVVGADVLNASGALDRNCTGLPAEIVAGMSFSMAVEADDEVNIVWANGDRSAVLETWRGPTA